MRGVSTWSFLRGTGPDPLIAQAAYQNRAAKAREQYQKELAEYNANKKAAAKADAAAPAADAPKKKKKRRDSEDAGERKKRKKSKKSKDKA